jgi:hypothetical protein
MNKIKQLKKLPLFVKTAVIAVFVGIIYTFMNSGDPSFFHLNLTAAAFGVFAYAII